MELTELYQKGKNLLSQKPYGLLMDSVETEFDLTHDRQVLDRYTFRLQCIDAVEARTDCHVPGINHATAVIMSAVTSPIPAIHEDGFMEVAYGLKEAGSQMWLGSQTPKNLKEIVATGVPVAANVRPFKDRGKMFQTIGEIQEAGVRWVGLQIDTGFKTGNDVLKALAMGAKAVGFASSMLLAYVADGAAGVELLINQITAELRRTMAATGCANLSSIDRSMIHYLPFMESGSFPR